MATNPTRRDILATMSATAGAVAINAVIAAEPNARETMPAPEYYELRALRLKRGPMPARVDQYLTDAFIPAARRAGCGPIGVFNIMIGQGNPTTYVLIPHANVEAFVTLPEKLGADAEYKKAAADFRSLPAADPPYVNHE